MKGLERVAADRRHLVARQVRCSTGFTWGMAMDGAARVVPLGVRGGASIVAVKAAPMPADLPDRLMAWLVARGPHRPLPSEAGLMQALGVDGEDSGAQWMAAAWARLERREAVRLVRGRPGVFPGEWLVRLKACGTLLRTAGAPLAWAEGGAK
jgi:hypothetical protein